MPEPEARQRDWFAPVMTLVTVGVAVWSLYFNGVQADVARKTFEMNCNAAHAGLQKALAELQKQVAANSTDRNLADLLGHLAELQAKLAEEQRRSSGGNGSLADVEQKIADVQQEVARLKKEQEQKDQEIASLRDRLAAAQQPRITSPITSTNPFPPISPHLKDSLLFSQQFHPRNLPLPLDPPTVDDSWTGRMKSWWLDLWSLFCKFPGPSIYFGLAALMALSKLFERR